MEDKKERGPDWVGGTWFRSEPGRPVRSTARVKGKVESDLRICAFLEVMHRSYAGCMMLISGEMMLLMTNLE